MLARQVGRLRLSLVLAQDRNDLLFREPATLHRPSLRQGRTLILHGGKTQWQVTATVDGLFVMGMGPSTCAATAVRVSLKPLSMAAQDFVGRFMVKYAVALSAHLITIACCTET